MATEIPKSVLTLKTRMRKLYLSWWITHYCVGFLGVIAGTLLTALTSAPEIQSSNGTAFPLLTLAGLKGYSWLIGIIAATCTSLVTFLGPIHKAEKYWSAYHLLDQACLEYEQGLLEMRKFVKQVKQARSILQVTDRSERSSSEGLKETGKDVH
ncbi:MAG TPA: hypothetical protein VFF26_00980 [Gallionella sp.]|nr:hypothetical protein [Gallionella sp.]